MSFFDEADEPRTAVRRPASRSAPPRRRAGGGGGGRPRPPYDRQTVRRRQLALGAFVVVLLIVVILGVNACQVSQRNSALVDYNSHVVAVITQSTNTSQQLFSNLTPTSGAQNVQAAVFNARDAAGRQLTEAQGFSVPSEDSQAQQYLVLALKMRHDGLTKFGDNVQQAFSGTAKTDAVNAIAVAMANLYASDVTYRNYALPLELGALKAAGIGIGGTNGQQVDTDVFLPDIRWLQPSFVAGQLNVSYAPPTTSSGPPAPGIHGHRLDTVSADGNTLSTTGTNNVSASPAPAFTLNFENDGTNTEHNVVCKVTATPTSGTGPTVTGTATVATTSPGAPATCTVTLSSAPATGSYTVTAQIERVPGEKTVVHNSKTFPVNFQ